MRAWRPLPGFICLTLLFLAHPAWAASSASEPSRLGSAEAPDDGIAQARLMERLVADRRAFQYGPDGRLEAVFGVSVADAGAVFFPVSAARPLPDQYVPPDLVGSLGHPLRAFVAAELAAMFQAAARERAYPVVVSGYRSADYQALVFERAVQRQLFVAEPIDREEAERRAARFVARPGHSQHQLGTTADLSSWEIGYAIRATFAETAAGRWLAEHAWEYGFVLPYTVASEARSGYVPEPWHVRWVGNGLAAWLRENDYLESAYPTTDDVLFALEALMQTQATVKVTSLSAAEESRAAGVPARPGIRAHFKLGPVPVLDP